MRRNGGPAWRAVAVLIGLAGPMAAGERDLASVLTAGNFLSHVQYLADDARAGRYPGTPTIGQAEDYIAGHFKQLGLKPGGDDGTYFQHFTIDRTKSLDETRATLRITGVARPLAYGVDFVTMPFSKPGAVSGPLALAGYGIEAAEYGYDDYEDFDPRGKVLLIVRHEPKGPDPDAPFGGTQPSANALFVRKARLAAERGALGVLVVNSPTREGDRDVLYPWEADEARNTYSLPMLHITQALADEVLGAAKLPPLADVVRELDEGRRALSTELRGLEAEFEPGVEFATGRNVVAILEGADRPDEYIVVGAHHDHVGVGRDWRGGGNVERQVHNGADDNASGTATVLEVARAFATGERPSRSVLFITFTGEEMGLLGSEHFVQQPTVPLESIRAMFNFDMVGRLNAGKGKLYGTGTAAEFDQVVARANEPLNLPLTFPRSTDGIFNQSDHLSFFKAQIPVLWAFTDLHDDYHRPPDDWELIDAEGGARIAQLAYRIVGELASMREGPNWNAPASQPTSDSSGGTPEVARMPRVRLGIVPDYEAGGEGLVIASIEDGGPAAAAGLKEGDRIVKLGDTAITGMRDYMTAVRGFEPGDRALVSVQRGAEQLQLEVTFSATPRRRSERS